jgi:hypothetical protein
VPALPQPASAAAAATAKIVRLLMLVRLSSQAPLPLIAHTAPRITEP